ncbi:MAG: glutathione S-transferase family protein [Nevskia sp.]|nr:glutathione S-transferase family protein [Nevskia sp.]
MKLYDSKIAPSTRRVRIFLAEKGIALETVEVDLLAGENIKPAFLKVNPRGLVPALVLDDGTCIDEVIAICRYLEETRPGPPLMGTDPLSRALVESRTRHMEIDGFSQVADVFRNSTPGFEKRALAGVAEPVAAIEQLVDRGNAGIRRYFDRLEQYLSASPYIAGDRYSIADIAALCFVDFAGWVKQKLPEQNVHTQRWYKAVSERPSAKA